MSFSTAHRSCADKLIQQFINDRFQHVGFENRKLYVKHHFSNLFIGDNSFETLFTGVAEEDSKSKLIINISYN